MANADMVTKHDLEQSGQGLRLAMAETMVMIRRLCGVNHAEQGDERGKEIQRGVG